MKGDERMRSLRVVALGAALLCAAMIPLAVSAGGWAVVTLDAMPTVVAGQETTIGFTLRQHGNTLLAGMESEIVFQNRDTGERRTFPAPDAGPQGHYAARVTLPAGTWTWTVNAFGAHPMPPLTVTDAAPASARPSDPAIAPSVAYPAMALLAAVALGGLVLGLRWRRPAPGVAARRTPQPVGG
jgi:hypothetical protein